jgi:drug/metabolite transporter (DMT)-like permease
MTPPTTPHRLGPSLTRRKIVALVVGRSAINLAGPVLAYLLIARHVHSDVTALVIAAAIPAAYTAAVLVWRRRLDPVGVLALVCFGVGLLLVIATGGNEFLFKVREDLWTGPLGLACLISLAGRLPLVLVVLQLVARRSPQVAQRIHRPGVERIATVTTTVVGALLVVHAAVMVVLALHTSTAAFLALQRPVSLVMAIGGLAPLVWWIRHQARSHEPLDDEVADPQRPESIHDADVPVDRPRHGPAR